MENKSKKTLFLINKLGTGGAEHVFVNDINALRSMGFDVYLGLLFGSEKDQAIISQLKIPNEKIFYIGASDIKNIFIYPKIRDILISHNIESIFSTLNESNIVSRVIKLFLPKIKVFIREANVAGPKPLKFKFLDIILNLFVNKIVCVSEEVRNSLLVYQPFYKGKMLVLMNGVSVPSEEKVYSGVTKLKILNVGSLNPKKGQNYLIEALSKIKKEGIDFEANIYGKGKEELNLKKQIADLGLEKKVYINSPISKEELTKKYLDADIFVLSSLWEGCPNVLLEAMAHGTASIATDVSGVRDMIVDGESGFIVPKGDANKIAEKIKEISLNTDFLQSFGRAGKKNIETEYSMDKHINKLIKIIHE